MQQGCPHPPIKPKLPSEACSRNHARIVGTCGPESPANCIATDINARTYSAGHLVRVTNGIRVSRVDQKNSCPIGYKIWSPRSRHDWSAVYNALGQNIRNYPRQPHLIVDVTRALDKCDTCDTTAMKSSAAHTSWWRTSDGSPWWLRDSVFPQPSDEYRANCYLSVYDVYPDHVKFQYGNCSFSSTDYLCQEKCKCAIN